MGGSGLRVPGRDPFVRQGVLASMWDLPRAAVRPLSIVVLVSTLAASTLIGEP